MMLYYLLLCLSVSCLQSSQAYKVHELNDRFLDIYQDGQWLVKFYAPWCGHCKKLEPVWMQVAQHLHDSSVRVGRVDCTKYQTVASHFNIRAYPTIKFIEGSEWQDQYNGDREKEHIVDYARRMSAPSIAEIPDAAALRLRQSDNAQPFFLYVSAPPTTEDTPIDGDTPTSGDTPTAVNTPTAVDTPTSDDAADIWLLYQELAEKFRAQHSFYSCSAQLFAKYVDGFDLPVVCAWRDGEFTVFKPQGSNVNASIYQFINKARFNRFIKVTPGNFGQVLHTGRLVVIAVTQENAIKRLSDEAVRFRDLIASVAENNKHLFPYDSWQFGWVSRPSVVSAVAATELPVPSLIVINSTDLTYMLPDDESDQMAAQAVVTFLQSVLNRQVKVRGGDSYVMRVYRSVYQARSSLLGMWKGNPVLTTLLFGLPAGFLALICYSVFCQDVMDADDEDEEEDYSYHEKHE